MLKLIGKQISRLVLFCLVLSASLALTGCSISERVVYEDSEGAVPERFFKQIRRNHSQKSWIVANLGEPSDVQQRLPGQEIYTYRITRSLYRNGQFLLVLHYGKVDEDIRYFHIALQDDIVKNHWIDSSAYVQIDTGAIAGFRELGAPLTSALIPAGLESARIYYSDQNRGDLGGEASREQTIARRTELMETGQVAITEPNSSRLNIALDAIRETFQNREKAKNTQSEQTLMNSKAMDAASMGPSSGQSPSTVKPQMNSFGGESIDVE